VTRDAIQTEFQVFQQVYFTRTFLRNLERLTLHLNTLKHAFIGLSSLQLYTLRLKILFTSSHWQYYGGALPLPPRL